MISTFQNEERQRASISIIENSYVNDQKLTSLHQIIFQKDNQVDAEALQQYLDSVRTNKQGKERIFTQKTQITYIISNVFTLLKRMLIISKNEKHFSKIVSVYIEMIKSRENSRHHLGLLEEHLKEVLNMDLYRRNKKIYIFIAKIFQVNPYIVYKILQARPQPLQSNSPESLKIYQMFIQYAASKKNNSLLYKQIKSCISLSFNEEQQRKQHISGIHRNKLDRLKILLAYFPQALLFYASSSLVVQFESPKSRHNQATYNSSSPIIKDIYEYLVFLIQDQLCKQDREFQICLLETIHLFIALPWQTLDMTKNGNQEALTKNEMILSILQIWKCRNCEHTVQAELNAILDHIEISEQIMIQIKSEILIKIDQLSTVYIDNSQNFKFLKILFAKLGRKNIEALLTNDQFINIIRLALAFPLKDELVSMLDTAKSLDIYQYSKWIHKELKLTIEQILSSDKRNTPSQRPQSARMGISEKQYYSSEDQRLALKALRKFKFDSVQVYTVLKQYVLKHNLNNKNFEYRRQVVKACLYVLTRQSEFIDKNKIMRSVLNLINKDINLKIMTIKWFRDKQSQYEKKIFEIFKQPEFLHILFQDYASNHMLLKRFSIKVLCFIYPLNQCQIVPFLKRAYYHIYDRLSAEKLVAFEQKKQALSLTRQILRHRTQIISEDSSSLCNFLYNDLYKGKNYGSDKQNQLLIQLFKTIVDLVQKTPKSVIPYLRPMADFIIKLLNSKDQDQKVKNYALTTFNCLVRNCNYVLLPYFHFPNLYQLLREILKQGNRNIDYHQILRLLGNLGFINKDKFNRIRGTAIAKKDHKFINQEFQKIYRQTTYLKIIKSIEEAHPLSANWNGPYLFTKQQTSYTYIEIETFKSYIYAKIGKIISEHPSKIINFMVYKVLEAFIPILKKEQEKAYQEIIIYEVLQPNNRQVSKGNAFSLISKIIRYQDTKQHQDILIDYLLKLCDSIEEERQYELMELLYIVTSQYPQQAFSDKKLKQIIFFIVDRLLKDTSTSYDIKMGLYIMQNLADCIDNFIHLFLPQFNKVFLKSNQSICLPYFEMILTFCIKAPSIEFYLPPISQYLLELVKNQVQKYRNNQSQGSMFIQKIMNFTICLIIIYGDRFKSFVINFKQLIGNLEINHILYGIADEYMKKHSTLNYIQQAYTEEQMNQIFRHSPYPNLKKKSSDSSDSIGLMRKSILSIIEEFNCQKNQIEDESEQWFNKICIVLFEKSSNRFINECLPLVKEDRSFSHDIFPLAFYFFWGILNEDDQKKMVNKLKLTLESKVISLRIKQKFIDTIYFMAQWKSPIPLKNKFLCDVCTEILDLAKALFYMQNLFENDPQTYGESLIKTYCQLGQKQSALGLLKIVHNLNTKTKILLYKKLKRYHEALKQYDFLQDPLKPENMLIKITIRKQMSDWESVIQLCTTQSLKNPSYKNSFAPLAAEAAVNLGKWDQVRTWLDFIENSNKGEEKEYDIIPEKNNYQNFNIWKTMLMIHEHRYEQADMYIYEARKAIYPKICQLFNFSFERSMQGVIRLQQLSELEEIVNYFKFESHMEDEDEKKKKFLLGDFKKRLESLWNDRIEGSKRNLLAMQQLLLTRNLLLTKIEDFSNWLDFCHLALKDNEPQFSKKTLNILTQQLETDDDIKKKFDIETSMIQAKFILGDIKDEEAVLQIEQIIKQKGSSKSDRSICKLYENCALWLSEKQYDFNTVKGNKCIQMLEKTTQKIKKHIKAWHLMGLMHLKMNQLIQQKIKTLKKKVSEEEEGNTSFVKQNKETHIFQALHCFIKSVSCGIKNHGFFLEDCLKILNILFNESEVIGLVDQLHKYYTDIPTDGLIDIIPQIISRIDVVDKPKLFDMMKKLLIHIGSHHPHAIVFPIVFLRKGHNENRKRIAQDIYKQMIKKDSVKITEIFTQTEKIVSQLCKVSLKLNEKFKIIVFKIYDESKTADPRIVAPKYLSVCKKFLQERVEELSLSEFGFLQQYRQELSDIINSLEVYMAYNDLEFFRKAERIIYKILDQLGNSLKAIKKISLDQASPQLQKIQNTHVCLPGTYTPHIQNIYISSFKPQLEVIDSKQRPKKLIVIGSDGKQHLFLLKGKEDLRLDERIMQLFNLINKMFHDPAQRQLYEIKGYSITPISSETGLIRWVQNCDTIGNLIQDYRSSTLSPSKKYLEIELSRSLSIKQYFKLPKPNKVELYKEIQTKVSGWDLRNIFWIRSINSEEWLKSRSTYIRSLAVMSMVGYIIGLGDRHPHNIMVQRNTGKIVHIDFGDCFDVNRMRKQFPQKVPFRLTRMLVKAMEPCGTHGIFKHTCEKLIKMLRNNKQSILTIIEAFRYDPIIGWKLKVKEENQDTSFYENNPTQQSCYVEEEKEKDNIDQKNKINLFGNKLNFEFAQHVLSEVKKKLGGRTGNDTNKVLSPEDQVQALITEAMSPENLVEHFQGWVIYW